MFVCFSISLMPCLCCRCQHLRSASGPPTSVITWSLMCHTWFQLSSLPLAYVSLPMSSCPSPECLFLHVPLSCIYFCSTCILCVWPGLFLDYRFSAFVTSCLVKTSACLFDCEFCLALNNLSAKVKDLCLPFWPWFLYSFDKLYANQRPLFF